MRIPSLSDHYVVGCMTRYLPWEKLSPVEAKEVSRAYTIPKSF